MQRELASRREAYASRLVCGGGDEHGLVGRELDGVDLLGVTLNAINLLTAGHVEDAHRVVVARGKDEVVAGAPASLVDLDATTDAEGGHRLVIL